MEKFRPIWKKRKTIDDVVMIGVEEEETLGSKTSTQYQVKYSVEDFLNIIDCEKDRHMSSELDNGVDHATRDSINSYKEAGIKREPTNETKISIRIVISWYYSIMYIFMFLYLGSVLFMLE